MICSFPGIVQVKIYATNEDELRDKIITLRNRLHDKLSKASLLIVTFGTAWGYRHKSTNRIVGNCHKAPSSDFAKVLTNESEMLEKWSALIEKLRSMNPALNIIFTVSPVRHSKDGLINNNRSKARLIELSHRLTNLENVFYFPSYEIVNDELRDYRFFKKGQSTSNSGSDRLCVV